MTLEERLWTTTYVLVATTTMTFLGLLAWHIPWHNMACRKGHYERIEESTTRVGPWVCDEKGAALK